VTATPTPTPSWDDIANGETVVAIHGTPDDLGRVRLDAFWRSAHGPGTPTFHNPFVGVRGQVFYTVLAEFIANTQRQGHTVRGVDDKSQALIDDATPRDDGTR
jgi:hypothetical protein